MRHTQLTDDARKLGAFAWISKGELPTLIETVQSLIRVPSGAQQAA